MLKKAINDLAAALKGQKNTDGIGEMEALHKLDKLLNKTSHEPTPTNDSHGNEPQPRLSQRNTPTPMMETAMKMPTPRVDTTAYTPTLMATNHNDI